MDKQIYYKAGFKYQLDRDAVFSISICPEETIITEYIVLDTDGTLYINKGYAWDGPSGPTIDTHSFMRGSLIHDALYQLLRMEFLPQEFRIEADAILKSVCLEDKMWRARAWGVECGLNYFGGPAADPSNIKKVKVSPKVK